jgi:hypothetical protein
VVDEVAIPDRLEKAIAGRPDPEYRSRDGAVYVQSTAEPHPFASAVLEAAQAAGDRRRVDPPRVTTGNTMAPSVVVAETAAALLLSEAAPSVP